MALLRSPVPRGQKQKSASPNKTKLFLKKIVREKVGSRITIHFFCGHHLALETARTKKESRALWLCPPALSSRQKEKRNN